MRLSLRRNTTQTVKTTNYDWYSLNNWDISNKYTMTLRNKFNALQEIPKTLTPYEENEKFVHVHMEAAAECIPTKLRAKHRILWEILAGKTRQRENRISML